MNNTTNCISLEKGKPLGVFEYAKEPLKNHENFRLLRHVNDLNESDKIHLETERKKWLDQRNLDLKNAVFDVDSFDLSNLNPDTKTTLKKLSTYFKDVFAISASDRGFTPYQYNIDWVKNEQPPLEEFYQKQFPTAPANREPVNKELARLVEIRIIEKASSAANILMIAVIKDSRDNKNK